MGNEEIELAVVIIVEPNRAGGKSRIGNTGFGGHVGKLAIVKITKQVIRTDCGDIDVVVSVIVIIADSAAESIHLDRESGLTRHVSKCAVFIIVVEGGIRIGGFMSRPVHGIDKKDVLPAVVIVIDEADTATHRFRQIFLSEGAGVVLETNTGLSSNVSELDGAGRARRSNGICIGCNW